MAAKLVFSMQNNFTQNGNVGICTCISLNWAKRCLKNGKGLNNYSELGLSDHTMNAQMAVIRKFDSSPDKQCAFFDLDDVGGDRNVASVDDVVRITRQTAPNVAIFWSATHTMGYRYSHNEKDFFDNEEGLFRAKTSTDIKKKMKEITDRYGGVVGMRVVKLKPS